MTLSWYLSLGFILEDETSIDEGVNIWKSTTFKVL
jgi:hypothetical protein